MSQYTVAVVYSPWPDAVVGVELGGDGANVATAYCTGLGYQPQQGDVVDVEKRGNDFKVTGWQTADRTWPPAQDVPQITVVDSPPGAGWTQVTAWVKDGDDSQPMTRFVRAAPPTVPPVAGGLTVMPLTGGAGWGSFDDVNDWRQRKPPMRQGAYGSLGAAWGLFFYGPSAFAGLAGQTVTAATIDLVRDGESGNPWAGKDVLLVAHPHPTQPGGVPSSLAGPTTVVRLSVDEGGRAVIPAAMVALLKAGTAAGLGVHSPASLDYLALRAAGEAPPKGGDFLNGRCRFTF